jgi:hypothetical protein
MSSKTNTFIVTAAALVAFVAAPTASFAAAKKNEASQKIEFTDPTRCLGGGCTVSNPDRVVNYNTSYYKRPKAKHGSASATNN